jgi:uroporphyrinogen-III synthase
MRALVLRPEPQAGWTAAALASHGVEAVVAPMLDIVLATGVVGQILDPAAPPPDRLVFTSVHAVEAVAADPRLADIRGIVAHAVGPATGDALRAAGFRTVRQAAGDGAALLADLVREVPAEAVVVHVAGRDRALPIADSLAAAGRSARTVEAYRAEVSQGLPEAVAGDLRAGAFAVAIVASRRTAEAFRAALGNLGIPLPLDRPALVAISDAAAEPLRDALRSVTVAARPDGEALTEGVVALAAALANNDGNVAPDATLKARTHAGEEPDDMPPEDRDGPGDAGRRKGRGRSTTIDLTATEVKATEPGPETPSPDAPVSPSEEAPAGASVSPDIGGTETSPPPVVDDSATAVEASDSLGTDTRGPASAEHEPPPEASARPARPEPVHRGGLGALAAAAIGGLVVLAGGAGLIYSGALPVGGGSDPGADDQIRLINERVADLGDRLAALPAPAQDLAQRVAAIEAAVAERPAAPADLSGDFAALAERVDALASRPADGAAADLAPLTARIDAIANELEPLKRQAEMGSGLAGRVDSLDASLSEVRAALDQAQSGFAAEIASIRADVTAAREAGAARDAALADAAGRIDGIVARLDAGPKGGEIAALSLAVTSLASRVAAGEPFEADLEMVRTAAPDTEGLATLAASAGTGLPTIEALAASFPAEAILAARVPQAEGPVVDRLFAGAKALVNYRETGTAAADPVSAGVDAIEAALAKGDAIGAKTAADALSPEARDAGAAWFADLDRRVAADAVVTALTDRILTRLRAPAEGQ